MGNRNFRFRAVIISGVCVGVYSPEAVAVPAALVIHPQRSGSRRRRITATYMLITPCICTQIQAYNERCGLPERKRERERVFRMLQNVDDYRDADILQRNTRGVEYTTNFFCRRCWLAYLYAHTRG